MKYIACVQILKDDFNNILIMKKKAKRGTITKWTLLEGKIRGKESDEKCLARAAKDVLKTIVFDTKPFKEFKVSDEEAVKVYCGTLKEKYVLDKAYDETAWINANRINEYDLEELDKEILNDYFM